MHDADPLRSYSQTGSPEAFAALVRTHIDLVYTAARRQTRDPHLADDITQAVFIVLSKKAGTISDPARLPGWLIRTTRYAAHTAINIGVRRRRHEQQAAAMKPAFAAGDDVSYLSDLLPALDQHLARLNDADRTAIVLRYFQDKPVREIAAALNVSEAAAQKRVLRALEKLRNLFARRQGGRLVTSTDALGASLAALPLLHAPAALTPMVLSAGAGPNVILIVKGALHSMFWTSTKVTATAGIAASVIIAASASALLLNDKQVAASQPSSAGASALATSRPSTSRPAPQFPNVLIGALQGQPPGYAKGIDDSVRRTPDSDPAAVLMSTTSNPSQWGVTEFLADATPYHGQRIRVSGYVKTEDVARWAGLNVIVMTLDGRFFAQDNMSNRPITGSTDWKRYDSVVDVSPEATNIVLGVALSYTGTVWADGFTITPVGKDVPLTDDRQWHSFSFRGGGYEAKVDPNTRRNGRPTTRFASTAPTRAGDWGGYDHAIRDIEPYLGKRVRLTMWLKGKGLTGGSGPHIRVFGANFKKLTDEGQKGVRPMRGTVDWKEYEAIADVPEDAQAIYPGITMNGGGTIWMDEVKVEVVP